MAEERAKGCPPVIRHTRRPARRGKPRPLGPWKSTHQIEMFISAPLVGHQHLSGTALGLFELTTYWSVLGAVDDLASRRAGQQRERQEARA
jgi:hypothetical protein